MTSPTSKKRVLEDFKRKLVATFKAEIDRNMQNLKDPSYPTLSCMGILHKRNCPDFQNYPDIPEQSRGKCAGAVQRIIMIPSFVYTCDTCGQVTDYTKFTLEADI